jgi:DNA-directed RNA polymerase specialized sigma24 family protein
MAAGGASLEALESLYRADLSKFVRSASAIVGDEAAGRDAVQEAFVQAVRKRLSFNGDAPLEAWVWRIVINEALGLRRRRQPELEWDPESTTTQSWNHVARAGRSRTCLDRVASRAPAPRRLSPLLR